jgi:hypothetical protein
MSSSKVLTSYPRRSKRAYSAWHDIGDVGQIDLVGLACSVLLLLRTSRIVVSPWFRVDIKTKHGLLASNGRIFVHQRQADRLTSA